MTGALEHAARLTAAAATAIRPSRANVAVMRSGKYPVPSVAQPQRQLRGFNALRKTKQENLNADAKHRNTISFFGRDACPVKTRERSPCSKYVNDCGAGAAHGLKMTC